MLGGPQIYMDSIALNSINNEFSFNKTKLNINDGYILLDGQFTNKEMYEVDIVMSDLNVEDLFKIINNEERYFGNINANINISNNNSNYIINTKSIVSDGKIDNIDYEKINADFSFRNKRFFN